MFREGSQIGLYTLIRRLGRGGFGEVWLAERKSKFVTTKVAVKLPLEEQVDTEAIKSEAVLWERASGHPNVLPIIEADEYDGQIVIVSEYAPDGSLEQLLKKHGALLTKRAVELAIGILNGLEFLHTRKIIHRDIKPANILLQGDAPRLADFGISRVMKTTGVSDNISGTPSYMAPEAFDRKRTIQTDIWSAGVVLYQMLKGKLPFPHGNLTDLFAAILRDEPEPLPDFVLEELHQIIWKSLAKNPVERYRTAREMRDDLSDFLVGISQQSNQPTLENEQLLPTLRDKQLDKTQANEVERTPDFAADAAKEKWTSTLTPNNLAEYPLPIIGREKEIAEIKDLLRQTNVRLVTMTGVGGTGKTKLSQAVARELLNEFSDGVFFIELAAITNADLVASTIAQSLGVKEAGGKTILEILKDYLRGRRMLLVIDNFEQITAAAPQIAELLSAAAKLKILITSRTLLHLSSEKEFVVPPLSVPTDVSQVSLDELSKYEAIKLFVERAQNAKASFALIEENANSVAEICARLDGLPLAIELAAARVKILSPQMILSKLENRLKLLTGGARDLPARQQTMRGAVEWSYDLLDEDEKRLFRRLSVFAGGLTFEAAEAVCADYDSDKESLEILDPLTSLVDKSLLISKEQADGEMRFRMLEVVREYALESLEKNDEAEAMRRRHADYFLRLGEEAEPHLQGEQAAKWLNRLEEEHDNLRDALGWSLENDAALAACLAAAIRNLWIFHGHLTEGRKWFEAAFERGSLAVSAAVRFKLLNGLGLAARSQGDNEAAWKAYEEGLAEGRAANDFRQIVISSVGLGVVANQQGDFKRGRKFFEEALAISRRLDDKSGIGMTLSYLGDLARVECDNTAARPLFEEALTISRQLGNKQGVNANLINLGAVAYHEGDFGAAHSHFAESLEVAQELGHKIRIAYSLDGFAALAAGREDEELGAKLAGAAEQLRKQVGYKIGPADRLFRDAYIARLKTKMDETAFAKAYEQGRKLKLEEAVALCLK
jgi:non-specific serine/threonine protein kinase